VRHGLEHPNAARDLNNLAQINKATGRLQDAEPLIRHALAIDEASYGTEHPRVAIQPNNLAVLLTVTDRMEEAELLMRRAVMILLKLSHQGYNHPLLQARLESYEILLHARGFSEGEIQAKLQDLQRAI
jgi:tetratricopeptide (TPR) repeat protein